MKLRQGVGLHNRQAVQFREATESRSNKESINCAKTKLQHWQFKYFCWARHTSQSNFNPLHKVVEADSFLYFGYCAFATSQSAAIRSRSLGRVTHFIAISWRVDRSHISLEADCPIPRNSRSLNAYLRAYLYYCTLFRHTT
jgi:hypothetical protein